MKDTKNFSKTTYSAPSFEIICCATECGYAISDQDDGWDTFLNEYVEWGAAGDQFE